MPDSQNPYIDSRPSDGASQPPVVPPVPPMPGVPPRAVMPQGRQNGTWQQRLFGGGNGRPLTLRAERTVPDWLIGRSVLVFFITFILCTLVWGYPMELQNAVISSLSLLLFSYGSLAASRSWARTRERTFVRNVFVLGLLARLLWAGYCYFIFNPEYWGTTYGDGADTTWYMPFGHSIAGWLTNNGDWLDRDLLMTAQEDEISFGDIMKFWGGAIDDVGYPVWLAILYILSVGESDVFVPFVVKCIVGAYCAVSIYNIAKRHFGEGAARMAALFVALNPNMIYWCGSMFKEAEMVFLCCLSVDLVDRTFSSGAKLTFKSLLPGVLVGMYVFFFRSALGIVIYLAMFAHIVMASGRVMSMGKKIIAGVLVGVVLLVGMGDRLRTQTESIREAVQSDQQKINMEWRAKREGGNEFAKYVGKAVFAPLIFTIPFPTFNVSNESQVLQRQLSGGNYIKNICSFFVILVMFLMLFSGDWRKHVFILAYTLGYLMTLVLSSFAQSSRFHMPIWPFLMLFGAYGVQLVKSNPKYKRWFNYALIVEIIACLAWNWFKLAGRGMI